MSLRSSLIVSLVSVGVASCGGQSLSSPAAPSAAAEPVAAAPRTEPQGESAAPKAPPASSYTVSDVAIVPARTSDAPRKMPKPWIETPGFEQVLGKDWVAAYKVILKVPGWEAAPSGSFIQFVLDGRPATPKPSFQGGIKLTDLAGDDLGEGEHVLAAYVCRPNHESIKGADGISVHRFWIGKKTPGEYKSTAPMLVLGAPFGSYAGQQADEILIDWYVLNAVVGEHDSAVRMTLTGPGLPAEGTERFTREWRPYTLVSPHNGDYSLKVELLDKEGQVSSGGSITRTFSVSGRDS
ncbi:MAG TPA: hypothetical protein VJT73_12745 [Polyangiaceae bacterium]|nr:hypothetical protein [Polyangiaceae bacterium]